MLSARSVIVAVIVIAVVSILGAMVKLAQPPGRGGLGRDSYGTRAHGLRGLYEVMEELKLPVRRSLVPTSASPGEDACIVFWSPHPMLVGLEPGHLQRAAQWIREGGKVVVAPSRKGSVPRPRASPGPALFRDTTVLAELGLPDVSVASVEKLQDGDRPAKERDAPYSRQWTVRALWKDDARRASRRSVSVSAEGGLAYLREAVSSLSVPRHELGVIDPACSRVPDGRISFTVDSRREYDLVALYSVGEGEIVVVSAPELFLNRSIAEEDNAVLAVNLLGRGGARTVFDEFYHGLTIRGNPAWLLTRHPYGLLVALLLAATGLWVWRECVRLGPPLETGPVQRRNIGEYVDAMARLFDRGRHRSFTLGEVRSGVLWALRRQLRLGAKQETVEGVARALGRRDPEAAERVRAAVGKVDAALAGGREPGRNAAVQAAKELAECL